MRKMSLPVVEPAIEYGSHPYPGNVNDPLKLDSVTIFLNRGCPRNCVQCEISDNSRKAMPVEDWIEGLKILKEEFDTHFFLFLGTEPLLFREGLIDLIKWFSDNDLFYAFYSTSPEPLFSRYKEQLVDAGLRNWSSGIDGLPQIDWPGMDKVTRKKIDESIEGLQWMGERGVEVFTLSTIHKLNLPHTPEVLRWLQDNIPGVMSSFNFIEWRKDRRFDFFSWPHQMKDMLWEGTDEERAQVQKTMQEIKALTQEPGRIIEAANSYLDTAHLHYDKINEHCNWSVGPAVDADGTMRICGYSRDEAVGRFHVKDLAHPEIQRRFVREWRQAVGRCSGCHWHWPHMLQEDIRMLDSKSEFYQERWKK